MSQIIENWAEIIGILISILPAEQYPGFVELNVRVETVAEIEGYKNLIAIEEPNIISILVKAPKFENLEVTPDHTIHLRVRAEGPPPLVYFADPNWTSGK